MKAYVVRAGLLLTAVLATACLDSKEVGADLLADVHEGMPKDSVLTIVGKGPLTALYADTLRVENGFRHSSYLIDGKTYEVLYYREQPGNVAEPVEQARETPIVLAGGKVLGWGWEFYLDAMKQYKLPSPIEAKPATPAAPAPAPATGADTAPKA